MKLSVEYLIGLTAYTNNKDQQSYMTEALYRWDIQPEMPLSILETLASYPRVQRTLLYNRGLPNPAEAAIYLHRQGPLYDPFRLDQMDQAVATILHAIEAGQEIAVYGDYDVDGVTASCLLVEALEKLGARVRAYIPNRFEEGYGVNGEALQTLHKEGVALTVTVDCGIRSTGETVLATELGMQMIICDHHEPSDELPQAAAVICHKKPGDTYPDKNLAGVGLAFKLAEALFSRRPIPGVSATDWLDLVAIGTVADLVPLTNENRSLVKSGLQQLRQSTRPGVLALAEVSRVKLSEITATTIGFSFGPRLNAAGRLETAWTSLNLMLSKEMRQARELAETLDEQNRRRQELTRQTQDQAIQMMDSDRIPALIAAADSSFNMGVVGLAASKLSEKYYRPAIVGAVGEEFTRASCRSIAEFHITQALDQCADLLDRHGGHAMAAGFTVRNENWSKLTRRLLEIAQNQFKGKTLRPSKTADMILPPDYFREDLLDQIAEMEPFGYGNPEAVFILRDLQVKSARAVGADQDHLRLSFITDNNAILEAIAFRQAFWNGQLPQRVDVLCTLGKNTWRDRTTLQLNVIDLRPAENGSGAKAESQDSG